jgi:hypothetical protein
MSVLRILEESLSGFRLIRETGVAFRLSFGLVEGRYVMYRRMRDVEDSSDVTDGV